MAQYAQLASLGLNLLSTLGASSAASAQAKAQATLDKAGAYAANLLRQGENEKKAAMLSLNTTIQSLNNQRTARAGDEAVTTLLTNYQRNLDTSTKQGLAESIAASEQVGRAIAAAAYQGVGGASSAAVERTLRLRASIQDQQREAQVAQMKFDTDLRKQQLQQATADSMDFRYQLAGMDYTPAIAPTRITGTGTDALIGWLGGNVQNLVNAFANSPEQRSQGGNTVAPNTPVASQEYGKVVSSNFFTINPSGVGVNYLIGE